MALKKLFIIIMFKVFILAFIIEHVETFVIMNIMKKTNKDFIVDIMIIQFILPFAIEIIIMNCYFDVAFLEITAIFFTIKN